MGRELMDFQINRVGLAQARGVLFDIQRYSLHDGPGLRTNVFFKVCSLACQWCSNPESRRPQPEIAFFERNCFLCGDCVTICEKAAITLETGRLSWDHRICNDCGRCAEVCTAGAFRLIGKEWTAGEVIAEVLRDAPFYGEGGGLTLTGGEPALQPEFAAALLHLAKGEGIHTAMETCGQVPWLHYAACLPALDLVLFDIKHVDALDHRKGTGVDNRRILENLERLDRQAQALVVRIPLIPGYNTAEEDLEATAAWISRLGRVSAVHLLPYHTLARSKYKALGLEYPLGEQPPMTVAEAEGKAHIFQQKGLKVIIGG
jgi:pyruvate formate lyase activating enzyme